MTQKEIRPTRILLVEDDIEQAGLIAKIMAKTGNGFEISWVPQLSQGLERLEQGGVDLVILDLGLPDSQGLETFIQVNKKGAQPAGRGVDGSGRREFGSGGGPPGGPGLPG